MGKRKVLGLFMVVVMCTTLLVGLDVGTQTVLAEDGLILHLTFDEDLTDASGTGNDAECTYGTITYEDGILGKSAAFNGKSYLEIVDNETLDLSSFTISLWAYKSDNMKEEDHVPYVYKDKDENSWSVPYRLYEYRENVPTIYLHEEDTELNQFELDGDPVDIRKWYLLTVTFDGSEVRMYENDLLTKKQSVSGTPVATIGNLYIGMDEGEYFYQGNMDDLRIYDHEISAQDVAALYQKGLKESPELLTQTNGLVAHYKFNGDCKDATSYSNDAELAAGKINFIDGKNGKAAKFTKGTYLEVLDDVSLDFDEGYSVTTWINIYEASEIMTLINKNGVSTSGNSNDLAYRILMADDYYDYIYAPFGYQPGELFFRKGFDHSLKNIWVHFGITFDTKEVRWYYNGKMVGKEEIPEHSGSNMAHSTGNLTIGSDGEYFFNGVMDELKLYNYKLSAKEIEEDYKNVDSLNISSDNQSSIKALKVKDTVTLTTSRSYIETEESSKVTSGVTYKSSNKSVFTVSSKGVITAVKKGSATLSITHGAITKTYKVTVK
ncbi:MAG: Ig-like protein [Herbinix sp.]|jgi:hypothetical protein|nr:Ig-like protein [Herbinix sp.]